MFRIFPMCHQVWQLLALESWYSKCTKVYSTDQQYRCPLWVVRNANSQVILMLIKFEKPLDKYLSPTKPQSTSMDLHWLNVRMFPAVCIRTSLLAFGMSSMVMGMSGPRPPLCSECWEALWSLRNLAGSLFPGPIWANGPSPVSWN